METRSGAALETLTETREDLLEAFLPEEVMGKRFGKRRERKGRFLGPVLFLCAILATLVAVDYWSNSGKIYRGVQVGTVDLGGKTPEEAREIVAARTRGPLKEMRLVGPDGVESFPAGEVGIGFDVEGTVDEAYGVGRRGSVLGRLENRLGAAWGTSRISPAVDFDPAAARERVEGIAADLDRRPVEGAVEVYGGEVEVGEAQRGYKTDVGRTLENVDLAVKDLRGEARVVGEVLEPEVSTEAARMAGEKAEKALSGSATLTSEGQQWVLPVEAIEQALVVAPEGDRIEVTLDEGSMRANLDVVYSALTVEPAEASYDVDGNKVSVVPGRSGRGVREDQLMARLNDGIFGGGRRGVDVPVFTVDPNLTTAEAERQRPAELLANYQTNYLTYDDSEGRIKNLRLASQAVNGTLVAPGEVFSFNALAAPLEYEESKVIIKGRVETAEGGGLCQVSSTLYMAANLAGLDVIERHPHYAELPYIRPGFDATVWFGRDSGSPLDMKFQNDSPGYLLLTEWVDSDGYVNASIFGRESGKEVEMSSRKVSSRKDDDGDPVNKWITRQKITQNGEVIFDDILHTDIYKTLKKNEATTDERPPN